jgi:hypothetical protein
MKKICYLIGSALMLSVALNAQTVYDATTFANSDLNGTARFIGVGGAMGALGGDISTMSTNPAGIGIYRSNDLMVTFGTANNVSKATFGDYSSLKSDKNHGTFDNLGFVYSMRVGSHNSPVQFVNFGFNYHRSQSLYGNLQTSQSLSNTSQIEQMNYMAQEMNYNGVHPSEGTGTNGFSFGNTGVGWLPAMAYRNGLLTRSASGSGYNYYAAMPVDTTNNNSYSLKNNFRSRERGGIDAYDLNAAINLYDRIYFGMTLSLYDVDYSKYTAYDEDFGSNYTYNVQSWNKLTGSGWDLKLGTIIRPFEESSFRVGLAMHTPTFYNLTRTTSTRMEANFINYPDGTYTDSQEDMVNDYGSDPDVNMNYKLRTPWVFNGSLGYVVGTNLALGAEYEYRDFSSSKLYDDNGDALANENNDISNMLKGTSTYRFGAEYKVIPEFALRVGFNHTTAAYSNEAFKYLPYNSIITDTDYSNIKQTNNFSFGFGYRGRNFYADFAYLYTHYNSDFYPFADTSVDSNGNYIALNSNLSSVKNDIHNFKITLGYRF